MSNITKHYSHCYWFCFILSFLLNICPIAVYVIKAVSESTLVYQKVALSMTVLIVVILTIVSIVNKVAIKSRLWIVLIGIYVCLNYIMTPLIIIAVCQVIDELIVSPLKSSFKTKLTINKQIDGRM